jgi:hypothetical protein
VLTRHGEEISLKIASLRSRERVVVSSCIVGDRVICIPRAAEDLSDHKAEVTADGAVINWRSVRRPDTPRERTITRA